jgi:hypothetical protein
VIPCRDPGTFALESFPPQLRYHIPDQTAHIALRAIEVTGEDVIKRRCTRGFELRVGVTARPTEPIQADERGLLLVDAER